MRRLVRALFATVFAFVAVATFVGGLRTDFSGSFFISGMATAFCVAVLTG